MTVADKTFTSPFDFIPEAASGQTLGDATRRWELFGGQMLLNAQPVFSVEMSATMLNLATGADTIIEFDTEVFDIGGNFNVGTYSFTAPEDGIYSLILQVDLHAVDSAATWIRSLIVTSNRSYVYYFPTGAMANDDDYVNMIVPVIADMDAADTAYATIRQEGGAAQMDVSASIGSRFMGWLLG